MYLKGGTLTLNVPPFLIPTADYRLLTPNHVHVTLQPRVSEYGHSCPAAVRFGPNNSYPLSPEEPAIRTGVSVFRPISRPTDQEIVSSDSRALADRGRRCMGLLDDGQDSSGGIPRRRKRL